MPKDYAVATAQGRRAKAWRNKRMAWDEFAAWMREPRRTPETAAEYAAMAKAERDAAKDGPFLSREDFRARTKVSKTICDLMSDLGLLGDLPESNQLSLFDF